MWTLGVVVLCAARAIVVWPMLNEYNINAWWFLVLDVGTAPAYGVGQAMGVKILRDERRPMRHALPWIAMVLFSFLAPYLYVLRSAGHLPTTWCTASSPGWPSSAASVPGGWSVKCGWSPLPADRRLVRPGGGSVHEPFTSCEQGRHRMRRGSTP